MTPIYFQVTVEKTRVRLKNMLTWGERGHPTKQTTMQAVCTINDLYV